MDNTKLPSKKRIFSVLCGHLDNWLTRKIYENIADNEYTIVSAERLVNLLFNAIDKAVEGHHPLLRHLTKGFIPIWIDGLVDEVEVAEVAKKALSRQTVRHN